MIALHRRIWQAGFTLMELMLSLALLALIMIILYGSFHAVAVSKLHAEVRVESDQQARTLIWLMCRELRGAVFTPLDTEPRFAGRTGLAAGRDADGFDHIRHPGSQSSPRPGRV